LSINQTVSGTDRFFTTKTKIPVDVTVQTTTQNVPFLLTPTVLVIFLMSLVSLVTGNPIACDVTSIDVSQVTSDSRVLYDDAANVSGVEWRTAARRDDAVCHSLVPASGLNLRSSCPWHYVEEDRADRLPQRILRAQLTCGQRCLKLHNGRKRNSSKLCLPVNRYVSVLECFTSDCGHRCCRKKLVAVPVAYTCAFGLAGV